MPLTNEELLEKATLLTTDFPGTGGSAPLSIEAADKFIEMMQADNVMLNDVRTVTSRAAKWQEATLDFSSRVAKPGVEFTRLASGDRTKPANSMIEISTVLLRGEVPVSDEVMEDNIARDALAGNLERLIANRFGYDIEELLINGDTGSGDPYLAQLNGWLKQAQGSGGHVVDASADGQDYQTIFKKLLQQIPARHKKNLQTDARFYVPIVLEEQYRDILANRGTALGDLLLQSDGSLKYQGIKIQGVPHFPVTAGTPDKSNILLAHRQNLIAGYRRAITFESFRDPREGGTSFVVTARVDAKISWVPATAIATNVDVEI
jgi:hypothetical protein